MISFIVIGRNEGWRLGRCLDSVTEAARGYRESEVLYVDSRSDDGSVEVARSYEGVRVFRITGRYNAAVARNIGAREARGDVLCFVDGDMELELEGLRELYDPDRGLVHGFVSGAWVDYNYASDSDQTPVSTERARPDEDHWDFHCGGLFLIARDLWEAAGGMRNKLRRNQDFDLAVRLAGMGTPLLRKGRVLARHHTTSPRRNLGKMFRRILSGAGMYRMVSLRDNILNRYQWRYFLRTSYTALLLWISAAAAAVTTNVHLLWPYVVAVLLRIMLRRQLRPDVFASAVLLMMINDLLLLVGLVFFWPRNPELAYEEVT